MKASSALFLLAISTSAHALQVYDCNVSAIEKSLYRDGQWIIPPSPGEAWTKRVFISPDFTNGVEFAGPTISDNSTVLEIKIVNGQLAGQVNGAVGFILKGSPSRGIFESAYHKGTVTCGAPVETPYLLQFQSWKQYFALDPKLSKGQILDASIMDTAEISIGNICYTGDIDAANKGISTVLGIGGRRDESLDQIDFTFTQSDCLAGDPESGCTQYSKPYTVTEPVPNCAGTSRGEDPRS